MAALVANTNGDGRVLGTRQGTSASTHAPSQPWCSLPQLAQTADRSFTVHVEPVDEATGCGPGGEQTEGTPMGAQDCAPSNASTRKKMPLRIGECAPRARIDPLRARINGVLRRLPENYIFLQDMLSCGEELLKAQSENCIATAFDDQRMAVL